MAQCTHIMNRITRELLSLIIVLANFGLLSCSCQNTSNRRSQVDDAVIDASLYTVTNKVAASETAEDKIDKTLNDIRFAGWTSKEWANNDYIRAVRKFIDAYNNGEIEYPYLDEHKEYIQGKFVIADIVPSIIGGALIYIVFYDHPEQTFSAHVYSDVDEKTRTISNYDCRGLTNENIDLGLSQEDIMQFLKECPEHKLW